MSEYQSNLMKEYHAAKSLIDKDAILLWRIGDFDEAFGEDAIKLAAALGFTVTIRTTGEDTYHMAGYPSHARAKYLKQLHQLGIPYNVCELDANSHRHVVESFSICRELVWT